MHDHTTTANPHPCPSGRIWFSTAAATVDRLGGRRRIADAIGTLAWLPYPVAYPTPDLYFINLMLRSLITELDLPRTTRIGASRALTPALLLGVQSPLGLGLATRVYVVHDSGRFACLAADTYCTPGIR